MRTLPFLGLLSACALGLHARDASACGGGFSSYDEVQTGQETFSVDSQAIALSVSKERTVLWSQIRYTGHPKEWAWVLPVGAGATLELADDAWFEALDAVTSTHIQSANVSCHDGGGHDEAGGCNCFSGDAMSAGEANGGGDFDRGLESVQVVHSATVGPYETVTISAASGQGAKEWLETNGYVVPAEMIPILEAYAAAGLDFLAMRLAPGAGVQQMQPVRVVAPGGSPIVPLRMMTAGAPAVTPITLYVISEGRYQPDNFMNVTVDFDLLVWDYGSGSSNYEVLRSSAMEGAIGGGFLTSFAQQGPHLPISAGGNQVAQFTIGSTQVDNLVDAYFAQAAINEGEANGCADVDQALLNATGPVKDCTAETGCDAGETDVAALACGGHRDLAVALLGMNPDDVWVTRLDGLLPREALSDDLVLGPGPQTAVASWHVPIHAENLPSDCNVVQSDVASLSASMSGRSRLPRFSLMAIASALALGLARRQTRKKRR